MSTDERLAAAGIEVVEAEMDKYRIVTRDGFVALIEYTSEGPGKAGAAGLLTAAGLAPLVWRDGRPRFTARGVDQPATPEQVAALRAFQSDLENALVRPAE